VTFKLNATGRKLLKAKRKLTATVAITITSAGNVPLVTRHRAVLRAPKGLRLLTRHSRPHRGAFS
jgi:hypothetical protein